MRAKLRYRLWRRLLRIFQVDAFTATRFTGNPATVVLDADGQNDATLLSVAREFSHAEAGLCVRRQRARITMCGCASSTRAKKRLRRTRDHGRPRRALALGRRSRASAASIPAPASSRSPRMIEQRATGRRALIEFRQTRAGTGPAAALQDHAAGRRSAEAAGNAICMKSCRRESRTRAAPGCWCRWRITGIWKIWRRTSTLCWRSAMNWRPTGSSCSP